jgi:hypothetical protein
MKKVFSASHAFNLCADVDPKEVAAELDRLGSFTPTDVVAAASSPESPLHKYFEWDDSKAAHKFRLSQARQLVLSIQIESDGGQTRAFHSVVVDSQRLYVPTEKVMQSDDLVNQVLRAALNELLFWKAKHQKYKTFFGGVFDEIDKSEEALRRQNEKESTKGGKRRVKARYSANKKGNGDDNNSRRQPVAG